MDGKEEYVTTGCKVVGAGEIRAGGLGGRAMWP